MKEPYSEGVAHHTDPESWGVGREAAVQALTGETASPVLSCENFDIRDADAIFPGGRQQRGSQDSARLPVSLAVLGLARAATPSTRNPGDPVTLQADGCLERIGKPKGRNR